MTALLPTRMVEKPWGRDSLAKPFTVPAGSRIGEIWFEPDARLPELLVKYIFTSAALSVQVHPSDDDLAGQGKTECWLVVAADPGARLALGLAEDVTRSRLRSAAQDGSIEGLLAWYPAKAGDFFYVPAGTIHAIGAGISLVEIQQTSDVTYRLYDYGRPRELHLDEALAVASRCAIAPELATRLPEQGSAMLVDEGPFRLAWAHGELYPAMVDIFDDGGLLLIPRDGSFEIDGEVVPVGSCGVAGSIRAIGFDPAGACLLAQPRKP
ncbi:MAG: class I mannose-6-phosphate isomerase [Novosphingobium sp.]